MGVIQSTSDQTIRGPETPSSRRVSTIASEIKQTKLTLKLLVYFYWRTRGHEFRNPNPFTFKRSLYYKNILQVSKLNFVVSPKAAYIEASLPKLQLVECATMM